MNEYLLTIICVKIGHENNASKLHTASSNKKKPASFLFRNMNGFKNTKINSVNTILIKSEPIDILDLTTYTQVRI